MSAYNVEQSTRSAIRRVIRKHAPGMPRMNYANGAWTVIIDQAGLIDSVLPDIKALGEEVSDAAFKPSNLHMFSYKEALVSLLPVRDSNRLIITVCRKTAV